MQRVALDNYFLTFKSYQLRKISVSAPFIFLFSCANENTKMLHFNLANYMYSINSILWVKLFEGFTGEGSFWLIVYLPI